MPDVGPYHHRLLRFATPLSHDPSSSSLPYCEGTDSCVHLLRLPPPSGSSQKTPGNGEGTTHFSVCTESPLPFFFFSSFFGSPPRPRPSSLALSFRPLFASPLLLIPSLVHLICKATITMVVPTFLFLFHAQYVLA